MSYVLGWKTASAVYLAADAMLTGGRVLSVEPLSSFGEAQVEGPEPISERALKIVTTGDLAFGLCGDFHRARNLASSVDREFRIVGDPLIALDRAIASNGPFEPYFDARLIVAWRCSPAPRLFVFNEDGQRRCRELGDGEGVQLGSAPNAIKQLTWEGLKRLVHLEAVSPQAHLVAALGLLQSHGIHDAMIPYGVGGVFTGAAVTRDAVQGQPDILFAMDDLSEIWDCVGSCVRDGALLVVSTLSHDGRVFVTQLDATRFDVGIWSNRWGSLADSYLRRGRFDYVILLGVQQWTIVVLATGSARESPALRLGEHALIDAKVGEIELRADVLDDLRRRFSEPAPADCRDFRFRFVPFDKTVSQ